MLARRLQGGTVKRRWRLAASVVFVPPMEVQEVTLSGKEITLTPLRQEHARQLFEGALQPGMLEHLAPGADASLQEFEGWVARRVADAAAGTALAFMIHGKQSGTPIGSSSMFNISRRHHRLEIGHTWIRDEWRGSKANPEAKLLMLTHAFETMDAVRVQFKVDVRNVRGQRAMEHIGAVREGQMRNERILQDGFIRDAFVYSIINQEWPEVKKQLNGIVWG